MNFKDILTQEHFSSKLHDLGQTNFSKYGFNDKHIKDFLDMISKKLNIPIKTIEDDIQKEMDEFKNIKDKAPILYGTIFENFIESEIFKLTEKHEIEVKNAPQFSSAMLMDLANRVKIEHPNFFPLRNIIDHKYVKNEQWIVVPSRYEKDKKYNSVVTAGATSDGIFIFNKNFCQKLLDFGFIKGIKGHGKKYQSNGGPFPDAWEYIEFVIIHEIMHYTQADWHYQKLFKETAQVSNWVGDFRSNYLLVKSGFNQLPMGLFSDHINYDRQKSMEEMYKVVRSEFDKLSKPDQDKVEKILGDLTDDHSHQDQDSDGAPGENQSGEGKPGKGKGQGTEGEPDKDGTPVEGKDKGKDGRPLPTKEEMEKKAKEINDDFEKSIKDSEKQTDDGKSSKSKAAAKQGSAGNWVGGKNGEGFKVEEAVPKYNWKQLISKCVASASSDPEETFIKPSRKGISSVHLVAQTGKASIKAGEIIHEDALKVLICLDISGSMNSHIPEVLANIKKLTKTNSKELNNLLTFVRFSNSHEIFKCDFKANKAYQIENLDDNRGLKVVSLDNLFSSSEGGATNFSSGLISVLTQALNKNYNVMIVSDEDIMGEDYKKLVNNHKQNFFTLWASKRIYLSAVKYLGFKPNNMTHF